MKDNFDDKLAKKIKASLENYPVEFDPSAWADLQKTWQGVPSVSVPFWKTLPFRVAASVSALIVTVGLACYWGFDSDVKIEATKLVPPTIQNNDSSAQIENANNRLAEKVLDTNVENGLEENSQTLAKNNLPKNTAFETQKPIQTEISKPKKAVFLEKKEKTNEVQMIALSVKSNEIPKDLPKSQDEVVSKIVRMEAKELVLESNFLTDLDKNLAFEKPENIKKAILPKAILDAESNPKQKMEIRFLAGVGASTGVTFGKDVNGAKVNYGGGVYGDLFLGKKIAISTGLQFTQINYETPQKIKYIENDITVSLVPDPTKQQAQEIRQIRQHEANWQVFQIPLTIKYFATRNLFFNVGAVSYYLGSNSGYETITYDRAYGMLKTGQGNLSERNFQPFAIAYLGAGFQKTFSKITLQIEPYMSLPLQEIGREGISSYSWAGLSLKTYFGSNAARPL